jgi:hypothetical protein
MQNAVAKRLPEISGNLCFGSSDQITTPLKTRQSIRRPGTY